MAGVEERAERLRNFTAEFESLVDVLCRIPQFVPSTDLNDRYRRLSAAARHAYGGVCGYLKCFYDTGGIDPMIELTRPDNVDEWLLMDSGNMIGCIEAVRRAIERYRRHLSVLGDAYEKDVSKRRL